MLPRGNEAARARAIAARIGRNHRQLIAASYDRAAFLHLSCSYSTTPYLNHTLTPLSRSFTTDHRMDNQRRSPLVSPGSRPTGQSPLTRSPGAGVWSPANGIQFAASPTSPSPATTSVSPTAATLPSPLAAHSTPKFKRRRKFDKSGIPPPAFSNVNHFQISCKNQAKKGNKATARAREEEEEDEMDEFVEKFEEYDDLEVPNEAKYISMSETEEFGEQHEAEMSAEELASFRNNKLDRLENYFGVETDEKGRAVLDESVLEAWNDKDWEFAQASKHTYDRKLRMVEELSGRARSVEELLIPDGKVDFWDIVGPLDKAMKIFKNKSNHSLIYHAISAAKAKRDARIAYIDRVQATMFEKTPNPRTLSEFFTLRAAAFEVFVAYALAGPLELRKLYELVMVEKKLLKATSTMLREVINKRWLRDEEILGFGTQVNIKGSQRLPTNYGLTPADTEVVNEAFNKAPALNVYHALGSENAWKPDSNPEVPPQAIIPPTKVEDIDDIGDEAPSYPRGQPGDPRTRSRKLKIRRAMSWAQRYSEMAWRAERIRQSMEPKGQSGLSWSSAQEFTTGDVDRVMEKMQLKAPSSYTSEDLLTRSLENTPSLRQRPWSDGKYTWAPPSKPEDDANENEAKLKESISQLTTGIESTHASSQVTIEDENIWSEEELDKDTDGIESSKSPEESLPEISKLEVSESDEVFVPAEEEVEEAEEEEAESLEEVKKRGRKKTSATTTPTFKLADENEPDYVEPTYFLDASRVVTHTPKNKDKPDFHYQLYAHKTDTKAGNVPVRYCTTAAQMDKIADWFEGFSVLGFDMEWASFGYSKNPKYNVSLIQIASYDRIVLFHLAKMTGFDFPPRLKALIENENIIKTGVAIKGDATRLFKNWGVRAKGLVELDAYHKLLEQGSERELKRPTLAALNEFYLGLPLSKMDTVRRSHWERDINVAQRTYAANDAYSCVRIWDAMEKERHSKTPKPARPDTFDTETLEEIEAKAAARKLAKKKKEYKSKVDELEKVALESISKEDDPLAALKEYQATGTLKAEEEKEEEEVSADDSDGFERLPTPEPKEKENTTKISKGKAKADAEATVIVLDDSDVEIKIESEGLEDEAEELSHDGTSKSKAKSRRVNNARQASKLPDISGRREFSTSSTAAGRGHYLKEWNSYIDEGAEQQRKPYRRFIVKGDEQQRKPSRRFIVKGDEDFMNGVEDFTHIKEINKYGDTMSFRPRNASFLNPDDAPSALSSERKFEAPVRHVNNFKKGEYDQLLKQRSKKVGPARSKEDDHEEPSNGPLALRVPEEPIRRVYPPEWYLGTRWANFVINREMVPRQKRSTSNPSGSGTQLLTYHMWHIQGYKVHECSELLSTFNNITQEAVRERVCQAIAMFPVSYDVERLKTEILDEASYSTKQTEWFTNCQKRLKRDLEGKKADNDPSWITEAVTRVDSW